MKNKVLYTEVLKAAEHLATVLRNYTDEPMYLNLCIFTRDAECHHEGDPDGVPDYYDVVVEGAEADDDAEPTISKTARVYYSEDQYGELIRTVIPYREQVSEDEDEQG